MNEVKVNLTKMNRLKTMEGSSFPIISVLYSFHIIKY